MAERIRIIECPRDAMQGIKHYIPTEEKIVYLNLLLDAGFDTIDFGSFVSPKAIPQLSDTALVLSKLNWTAEKSRLLAIIANTRGAKEAAMFDEISYLGFPFSVSETFQQRNANASIKDSLKRVEEIQNLCVKHKKELVLYISMAFGNPYGDAWSPDTVMYWTEKMVQMGIKIISLADTVGVATAAIISSLFKDLIPRFSDIEFGAHFHTTPETWREKMEAAYTNGCKRFDGALRGFGGCPMAMDKLTGNMPTENIIDFFTEKNIETGIREDYFLRALKKANEVFH
ncbi:MAG: hydroxymethylglutaryl-CoA lyase [Chitinophagales bacterium]|nr:hydroxymethylglutaryl-CoA lyase [Chitinophagales bacterium]